MRPCLRSLTCLVFPKQFQLPVVSTWSFRCYNRFSSFDAGNAELSSVDFVFVCHFLLPCLPIKPKDL
eukprot:m.84763 g.84763  ORF g.84763 m.84763 type:complete len:67 (-) comp14400_c0_seq1:192-392(-)